MRSACVSAAMLACSVAGLSAHAQVVVDARANLFGAGLAVPPDPTGGGPGLLPTRVDLGAGGPGRWVEVGNVVGEITNRPGGPLGGADGRRDRATDILSVGAISGIVHNGAAMFLAGVFLGPDATPPAPARLDVTGIDGAPVFTPALGQMFFIGDGLTGTGAGGAQRFVLPAGATRLFLGFADAYWFGTPPTGPHGALPGSYSDNEGALSASVRVVPTPGALALGVLAGIAVARRRR